MSSCDICGKEFKFPYLLLRHLNRVTSCSPNKFSIENGKVVRKTIENPQNVNQNSHQVNEESQKVTTNVNYATKIFKCDKCEKILKSKLGLKRHEKICKGVSSLQCPTCFKSFSDKTSKYKHIKNVKCSPPEDTSEPHKNSVYLLIEREFMITKENIFKIGRSVKVCNRARQYPKGSQLLVVLPCIDSVATECNLKRVFSEKFIHRSDIGAEYYEGPPNTMIKEFVANVALHF